LVTTLHSKNMEGEARAMMSRIPSTKLNTIPNLIPILILIGVSIMPTDSKLESFLRELPNPITFLKEALNFQQEEQKKEKKEEKKKEDSSLIPEMTSIPSTIKQGWQIPLEEELARDTNALTMILNEREGNAESYFPVPSKFNASSLLTGNVMKPGGVDEELIRRIREIDALTKKIQKKEKK